MAFFDLGHARSLQAVADKLGESLGTVKNWSSKFDWTDRLQAFNSGLLQQQAQAQTDRQLKLAADWARRLDRFRERDWDASEKLAAAAQCFLESFGEEDLRKMTLAQVSRALKVSSDMARSALSGAELPPSADPVLSPIQQQMLDAVARVYGTVGTMRDPRSVSTPSPSATRSPSPPQGGEGRGEEAASTPSQTSPPVGTRSTASQTFPPSADSTAASVAPSPTTV